MRTANTVDLPRLRAFVGHSPYSWHQVVKKCNLSRSSYRYWNGLRPMPLEVALQISYLIKIPFPDFAAPHILWLIHECI